MNSQQLIIDTLDVNYPLIREKLGDDDFNRYVNVLAARAIEFYLEHDFDLGVVEEDLYSDDEEHQNFPNLDYAEVQQAKFAHELANLAKSA